jgi:3',5'-cyclic AMP phosphodiesterase CpdA
MNTLLPSRRAALRLVALGASSHAIGLFGAPGIPAPAGHVPERMILTWSGDPTTTQSVTWETAAALTSPQAQVARMSAHPNFEASATTVQGVVTAADANEPGHYAVTFTGLDAGTRYLCRVGDGKSWSEWSTFRTADATSAPFRFLYVGDAQNSIKSLWSRTIRAAYAAAPDARFIASAGDLVAEGHDVRLWNEWRDAQGFITATIPSLPVVGNHDLHRAPGSPEAKSVLSVSPIWHQLFALPDNGPDAPEMKGQSYFMDYQGVRFVVVDVNVFANEAFDPAAKQRIWTAQLAWVNKVLANNPNRWTIVLQHQPLYAMAKGRDYQEMRAALGPVYEKYGVDLVLLGHDHLYSRSHKVIQGRVVDPSAPGIIHAISVSGPKMYEVDEPNRRLMAQVVDQTQCFQVIAVAPQALKYVAYDAGGDLVDRFELQKSGNSSTYVNQAPAIS